MNARVLAVGALKENWQREACAEYLKRLSRYGKYDIVEVPDEPESTNSSPALNQKLIQKEGQAILRQVKSTDCVVALCIRGKELSSEQLAGQVRQWENAAGRTVFIIGGSLGLSKEVEDRADFKLSFSPMTFPHQLMRVILFEQLYRAEKINAGERYHK